LKGVILLNGRIIDRIAKQVKDKNGRVRKNVKVYDVKYRRKNPNGDWKDTTKRGFITKKEAQEFLLTVQTSIFDQTFVEPQKMKLKEYLLKWYKSYCESNLRYNTKKGYLVNIERHIIPYIGELELQKIESSHVEDLYRILLESGRVDKKGGLSAKSVLYVHRVLCEAIENAVKKKYIARNIVKDVSNIPRPKRFKNDIYSSDELKELIHKLESDFMLIPVVLAGICGLRRGEISGLLWSEVDFSNLTIRVCRQLQVINKKFNFQEPKSEESIRTISVPKGVMDILKKHREQQEVNKKLLGEEYQENFAVIAYNDGRLIDPRYLSNKFSRKLKELEMKHIRLHDLRHSAASLMLSAGVDLKVASGILGHSSISITADIYQKVLRDVKVDAANKIGNKIFDEDESES
jgi:integrase